MRARRPVNPLVAAKEINPGAWTPAGVDARVSVTAERLAAQQHPSGPSCQEFVDFQGESARMACSCGWRGTFVRWSGGQG